MARKGHIRVKKKVSRRRKEQAAPVADPDQPHEPRQVQLGKVDTGVPEGLIEELVRTHRSITFASVIQFIAATISLGLGGFAVYVAWHTGVFSAAKGAETLSSDLFFYGVQIVFALIAMSVFLTLGLRMRQFTTSIDALEDTTEESDLEYVLGYLRGVWLLLSGVVIVLLVLGGIVTFLMVK